MKMLRCVAVVIAGICFSLSAEWLNGKQSYRIPVAMSEIAKPVLYVP
jgi:hypothetical protein